MTSLQNGGVRIGITDTLRETSYEKYLRWIQGIDPAIEVVKLSPVLENAQLVNEIDGLILTGGGDVHPGEYGREDAIGSAKDVNRSRDDFEFGLIEAALEREIPLLGICRGMQIMNVYLGGSLIVDLSTAGYAEHAIPGHGELRHTTDVLPGTMLESIVGPGLKKVNSSHHQAVDRLGKGLIASARSEDGVTEAAEWALKDRMPFLLLVQWHPERMTERDNPCAGPIARHFLKEVSVFSSNKRDHLKSDQETEHLNHG